MPVIIDKKRIGALFDRGIVSEILPSKEALFKLLFSGRRLRIYIGADPTAQSLHLSHAKNYMFLEELRELGHEVIILVGDFTAQIGDPTGRKDTRKQLTEGEVKANVKNWIKQIRPLVNFKDKKNPPKVLYNSAWLSSLTFKDVVSLASNFTVQQMIERDMFEKRWKQNEPIHLHEFLYPLMQGYDSVAMGIDIELCGTDQIFNALAGRTLLRRLKNKEKVVVAVNLMANPRTGELMSKSRGAGVFLSSPPAEMYGAIMAQPDEMIGVLFVNCTRIPLQEKDALFARGPRSAKAVIAKDVVRRFYGEKKAEEAETAFVKLFSKKDYSGDLPVIIFSHKKDVADVLIDAGVIRSRSEGRRLALGNAIKLDDVPVIDVTKKIEPAKGTVLKVGKKRIFRVDIK